MGAEEDKPLLTTTENRPARDDKYKGLALNPDYKLILSKYNCYFTGFCKEIV